MRIPTLGPLLSGSVRARLLRLALLLLLPGLILAILLTKQVFVTEQQGADTALLEAARGLSQVIERDFAQAQAVLRTLAAVQNGHQLDQAALDRLARETAVMQGAVVIRDAAGQELVDTALPPGASLPRTAPPASDGMIRLERNPGAGTPGPAGLSVVIPQAGARAEAGQSVFLELRVPAAAIATALTRESLPPRWVAAVIAPDGTIAARTVNNAQAAGRHARPETLQALATSLEGVRNGTSLEKIPVVFAYHRSDRTGWTVVVNSPQQLTVAAGLHSIRLLLMAGSLALVLGVLGASHVARNIARRIEAMAGSARALGALETWLPIPPGLDEADAVGEALRTAAAALTERRQALSELNATLAARVEVRTSELAEANRTLEEERRQLGVLLDHLPIGVVVDEGGSMVFANREARLLLRLPAQGSVEGAPWPAIRRAGAILPEAERPWVLAARGVVTERILLDLETDGRQIDLEVTAIKLRREAAGQAARAVTILQDVSARLEAEEARRRSQRLEAVGQLTGGVAHEFNNLLMAVSGCLELLSPSVKEGRGPRLLANAQRATERGGRLTRQLLAFARRQHLTPEPTDLNALVQSMHDLLEGTLGRSVAIVTALDPEAWPALADSSQVELSLLNLAFNARDAMPGGGQLTLATENVPTGAPKRGEDPPAGEYAVLRVSDTGIGMTPAVLARAFEPFFTTKDVGFGSGLGLPQVLGVAQQLGGGVTLHSTLGHGTSVAIYLPRAREKPGLAPRLEASGTMHTWLTGLSLLVVDDDADVREIARDMLTEMGARATTAEGAAEALLHLRTAGPVDLVLADLTMPQVSGLELARELDSLLPALPVVLMTGYGAVATDAAGPNIRAILQKPFRADALAQAIASVLRRHMPGYDAAGVSQV